MAGSELIVAPASACLWCGSEEPRSVVGARGMQGEERAAREGVQRLEIRGELWDWSPPHLCSPVPLVSVLSPETWGPPGPSLSQCKQRRRWVSTKSSCRTAVSWCCVHGPSFAAVSAAYR